MPRGVAEKVGARTREILGVKGGRRGDHGEKEGRESRRERQASRDEREENQSERNSLRRPASYGSRRRNQRDGFEVYSPIDWLIGILLLTLVIFAFSPGVLFTIPPGRGKLWMSGLTSIPAALVHAVILVFVVEYIL